VRSKSFKAQLLIDVAFQYLDCRITSSIRFSSDIPHATGRISLLERNIQLHKLHASIMVQEQERLAANPSTEISKETAVTQWRFSNPESCGNSAAITQTAIE
jgi:hypothetical protein